ncbi:UDP-N-acetylmuramate--L-alanine ligase, partial [Staphylococcus epidermidis]|nr:UDP-N-acetylmuramate--L-alanine ligase [Staphylococcus epidermidis]
FLLLNRIFHIKILGSIRENTGDLTIEDLINRIDGSTLIDENSIDVLEKFDNAVILFMGAGDIQKLLKAYFEKLGVKNDF